MASCCDSCRGAPRRPRFRSWGGWGGPGRVLEALGMRQPGSGMRDAGSGPATPPVLRDASSGPPATPPASRIPHPDPPEKGPLTLDRLRALWPRIVDDARTKSPMLGALLQVTEVAAVDAGAVTIRLLDTNAVHAEGLERQREALSQLVTRYLTGPVRIKLEGAEGGGSRERSAPRPTRLTEEGGRAEIRAIKIDPQAIAQGDVEMLEDLVLAAVSQAQQRAAELYQAEVKKLASGLPFPFQLPL